MTNVTFISGLKEIGGTFVRVETDGAVCLFDFGFAVAARIDPAVRLRAESLAADYARLGMLPREPGIYEPAAAAALGVAPYAGAGKPVFFFISHMHIDHMGGLDMLDPGVPVYMSAESLTLYRRLVAQGDITMRGHDRCIGVPYGGQFTVEDITVEVLPIDHDCIGAAGCRIRTPAGTLVYTGDYRFHGFHPERTRAFAEACRGADLLITEGVTVSNGDVDMLSLSEPTEPDRTEYTLLEEFAALAREEPGLLVVNYYERNVERVWRHIDNFAAAGRTLVLDARLADYVAAFYPQARLHVYGPTIHGRPLRPEWQVVNRSALLADPTGYVLQLDYADSYELLDLTPCVSRYLHADGAPLGAYDASYAKLLELLKAIGVPYDYRSLGGHASPYYLRWMADTIAPRILVPLHSFRPEQVASARAGCRILPQAGQTITL
ncbi:MAG: MBL fold metallo-hydrolase [Gemmiger sp.]